MRKLIILFLLPITILAQEIVLEEVNLNNGEIALPGTLSFKKSKKKLPLIIFIHGSGNIDRDGNQAGVNVKASYIKSLSEELSNQNIAFYRYDKRTATSSNIKLNSNIFLTDFVADAKVAINHFTNDKRFNKIFLIGHSQGSLTAMLALTKDIDGYISIAGPGESIDKTIIKQVTAQSAEYGKITATHFDELIKTDTILKVNPQLISIFHPKNQKFFKSWATIDPLSEMKKVTVPTLILNGDADTQVSVEDAEKLKQANQNATLHIVAKMNHLLKEVNSSMENQQSYGDPNFPISQELVKLIVDFVKK